MTGKQQKETNQEKLSSPFPHAHNESQENQPSDCGHHTFEKRCTSSFRPSKHFTTTRRDETRRGDALSAGPPGERFVHGSKSKQPLCLWITFSTKLFTTPCSVPGCQCGTKVVLARRREVYRKKIWKPSAWQLTVLPASRRCQGNWLADTTQKGSAAHVPSPSFLSPSSFSCCHCHSPSTVRKKALLLCSSAQERHDHTHHAACPTRYPLLPRDAVSDHEWRGVDENVVAVTPRSRLLRHQSGLHSVSPFQRIAPAPIILSRDIACTFIILPVLP